MIKNMFTYIFKDIRPLTSLLSMLRCDEQVDLHFSPDGISFRNYILGGSIGLIIHFKVGSFLTDIQCTTSNSDTVLHSLDTKSTCSALETITKTPHTEIYHVICKR